MIGYEIDSNGYYTQPVIYQDDKELNSNIITIEIPQGLYKAKWNGLEWVEGATQEYINSLSKPVEQPQPTETTEDYLMDLDYRVSKIELGLEG